MKATYGGQTLPDKFMWPHACHAAWGSKKSKPESNPICREGQWRENCDARKSHRNRECQVKTTRFPPHFFFFLFPFSYFAFSSSLVVSRQHARAAAWTTGSTICAFQIPWSWLTARPRMLGDCQHCCKHLSETITTTACLCVLPKMHCTAQDQSSMLPPALGSGKHAKLCPMRLFTPTPPSQLFCFWEGAFGTERAHRQIARLPS
ncbi:hypothetical protein V8C35DRAFT_141629 [Trichoderma chlorosporum]